MTNMSPCVPATRSPLADVIFHGSYMGEQTREVMPPQWPYFVLTAHVPDIEFNILVCYSFDVEADSRDSRNILIEL